MARRASRSVPSAKARGRLWTMRRAASSDHSLGQLGSGLADVGLNGMGQGVHSCGSGNKGGQAQGDLRVQHRVVGDEGKVVDRVLVLFLRVSNDSGQVASLPVPAVVGTAIVKGVGTSTRSRPFILRTGLWGRAIRAPTPLAQSMTEPPPTAMMAWAPLSR